MRLRGLLRVLLGLAIGCVLAELLFQYRDDGAFPHLNFYERDDVLGVRLVPRAHMALAFGGNPVTQVRTNERGFRGADWPQPGAADVLVVGDSQVFGLGVDEAQTFSARLQRELGGDARVLNAGVPTYGPLEYSTLVERLVLERKPDTVVYVVNVGNDLLELPRANTQRHAVWDGWAVRKENAPSHVTEFPFRPWLMSQSHLVFALRQLLHDRENSDEGRPSEGSWSELVQKAPATHPPGLVSADAIAAARSERDKVADELASIDTSVYARVERGLLRRDPRYATAVRSLRDYHGDPGDIVSASRSEESATTEHTAVHLLLIALASERNEPAVRELAQRSKDTELVAMLERRRTLRAKLAEVTTEGQAPSRDALDLILQRTKRACDSVAARLLVVALPLDVQVSKDEWKKYHKPAIDLSPTRVLNEDIVARARAAGALGFDAMPALAAAEPGAFLDSDPHMSPKGHAALAHALQQTLVQPAGAFIVPEGRSALPLPSEWDAQDGFAIDGEGAGCQGRRVREWLQVRCEDRYYGASIRLLRGGRGDAIAIGQRRSVTLILPVLEGDSARAEIRGAQLEGRMLQIDWPLGQGLNVRMQRDLRVRAAGNALPPQIAAWLRDRFIDQGCDDRLSRGGPFPSARACVLGDETPCADGEIAFGMLRRCVPRCDAQRGCDRGRCAVWNGERGCIEP